MRCDVQGEERLEEVLARLRFKIFTTRLSVGFEPTRVTPAALSLASWVLAIVQGLDAASFTFHNSRPPLQCPSAHALLLSVVPSILLASESLSVSWP